MIQIAHKSKCGQTRLSSKLTYVYRLLVIEKL